MPSGRGTLAPCTRRPGTLWHQRANEALVSAGLPVMQEVKPTLWSRVGRGCSSRAHVRTREAVGSDDEPRAVVAIDGIIT
jgi:hypothetical protein